MPPAASQPALPRATSLVLALALLATGCGGGLDPHPPLAAYRSLAAETAEAGPKALPPGLAAADALLRRAAQEADRQPSMAAALYLEAAERLEPLPASSDHSEHSLPPRYYRHAVGQATALLHRHHLWNAPLRADSRSFTVRPRLDGGRLNPTTFDSLTFADPVRIKSLARTVTQPGVGAPLVATLDYNSERAAATPFMHEAGFDLAVTAVVEFSQSGDVRLSLHDPRKSPTIPLAGRNQPPAANFSLPLAMARSRPSERLLGFRGVFKPASYLGDMSLYTLEPPDPERIPLVFIHGLASDPTTWAETYNEILADPVLRRAYQGYAFYYPTGLPPMYPAAGLKASLNHLHRWLTSHKAGASANRMILVGHSMGGLLTSAQIRDYRGAWDELSLSPMQAMPLAPTSRQALETLFNSPPPRYVKRAVFIATPHRGSTLANGWIGRLASSVSKVPEQLLSLQLPAAARSMTDLGRSILLDANPVDAIHGLRYGNPLLRFNESRKVAPWIPYHSIIGDRGKGDTSASSDGIVPYASSHLPGAQSERIVPCGHSVHLHPEGIAEIKRILHLHLRN